MARPVRLPILLCCLVAIASNCIQATQISFHRIASLADFSGEPSSTAQNNDTVFLITDDDDSHDTPHLIQHPIQTEIDGNQPFPFSLSHPGAVVTAVEAKRHTVLRL
jgi:hypothetical protein